MAATFDSPIGSWNWTLGFNATNYVPSAKDLALAGPRMFMKLGNIFTLPDGVDNIFGIRLGQSTIPAATGGVVGASIVEAATTAAAGGVGGEKQCCRPRGSGKFSRSGGRGFYERESTHEGLSDSDCRGGRYNICNAAAGREYLDVCLVRARVEVGLGESDLLVFQIEHDICAPEERVAKDDGTVTGRLDGE